MRLFVGIPLPDFIIDELSRTSLRFQSPNDGLRWSAPESWHVTLQFLGSVQPDQHACITAALRDFHHAPVPIQLDELGFFDRAGVFFAGVRLSPALLSLQQQITAATAPCGFVPDTRPFHPHITLARSKGKAGARSLRALQSQIQTRAHRPPAFKLFLAREFVLYESLPTPSGSRYEVRDRFPLD